MRKSFSFTFARCELGMRCCLLVLVTLFLLARSANAGVVYGNVLDKTTSGLIEQAKLTFRGTYPTPTSYGGSTYSDSRGAYSITLVNGYYYLTVTKSGYKTYSLSFVDASGVAYPLSIYLEPGPPPAYGSLCVTITPKGAVDLGAMWRVTGSSSWLQSGYTRNDVQQGIPTVEFSDIPGWKRPASQSVTIVKDQFTSVRGEYVPDDLQWTKVASVFTGRYNHTALSYNGKLWVIAGDVGEANKGTRRNDVWCSEDDGNHWTLTTPAAAFSPREEHASAVWAGRMWVIGGRIEAGGVSSEVWYSADGAHWTLASPSAEFPPRCDHTALAYDGKLWVIGGTTSLRERLRLNDVWCSSDGAYWTEVTASASFGKRGGHSSLVFDNKMWVIGGNGTTADSGIIDYTDAWCSSDGATWTQTSGAISAAREWPLAAPFGGCVWLYNGGWASSTTDSPNGIFSSADGAVWSRAAANFPNFHHPNGNSTITVHDGGVWILGGNSAGFCGMRYCSVDGVNWSYAPSDEHPARAKHASTVFKNKIWTIAGKVDQGGTGARNDIWSSGDGLVWSEAMPSAPFGARYAEATAAFRDKLWVIGGYSSSGAWLGDIWNSGDGLEWNQVCVTAPFGERANHRVVEFDDKLWVIGGSPANKGVWYSEDGATWAQATASPAFGARYDAGSVSFGGKIWVIGGKDYANGKRQSDIWSSPDGANWTQTMVAAPFGAREGHACAVWNNKIWVIGGYDGNAYLRDAWCSDDGVTWTQASSTAGFIGRAWHSAVVFDDKLWVLAGARGTGSPLGDVWCSDASGYGSLTVNIGPQDAVDGGGKWRRRGTAEWLVSGETETGIPACDQVVEFDAIAGWTAPSTQNVTIAKGETSIVEAVYVTVPRGSLQVTISPLAAVVAGAQWRRVGQSNWMDSGATETNLSAGTYTIEFKAVTGWVTPTNREVTVSGGQTTTLSGTNATYTISAPTTGSLQVTLAPQTAVDAGAQWRIVGESTWRDSGTTAVIPTTGQTNVEFKTVTGWVTPAHKTAAVVGGAVQPMNVTYVQEGQRERCNVDASEDIDAMDVQLVINAALKLPVAFQCDVNRDSTVDAMDVQLVINAALRIF